ncbi:alpha/beta hydrolase family protein [Kibdelosporangium phytohabitans]|uniref:PET hydrolase/cutinase-like domain-containing protein n=1 Tax=Kibdelosporangium phytohabitans TaxID=860235 RepID=A0A0N9IER5_9PSEU|nr:alpha/beta hydrolase [Kibdelosporangium phytohabitans]ALG15028.1 hypothetical protein AOZ06_24465 [Kibdelosporangium phytohabitans]MBE1469022.1 putative dienelactone hydrolase [Kibdelosporangium phytohabitans]
MFRRSIVLLAAVLAFSPGVAAAGASAPAANPYERGPAPTEQALLAPLGSFTYSTVVVPRSQVTGFGGGTIYYPDDTSQGTYGGVVAVPGFVSPEGAVAWLGPHMASRGFVVFTIATTSPFDQPTARGKQLLAALDHLTQRTPDAVRKRLDPARLAVTGHSMGGGGALYASGARPGIKAAIPLAPYNQDKTWNEVATPTLVVGGSADQIASVDKHARPFYNSLTGARDRGLLNVAAADHGDFTQENSITGRYAAAWLKRFVDEDTRYDQYLCPATGGPGVTEYSASCPLS